MDCVVHFLQMPENFPVSILCTPYLLFFSFYTCDLILRVAENDCQPNQSAHVYTVDVILMSSDFSIAVNAVSSTSISHSDILNHILLLHTC